MKEFLEKKGIKKSGKYKLTYNKLVEKWSWRKFSTVVAREEVLIGYIDYDSLWRDTVHLFDAKEDLVCAIDLSNDSWFRQSQSYFKCLDSVLLQLGYHEGNTRADYEKNIENVLWKTDKVTYIERENYFPLG